MSSCAYPVAPGKYYLRSPWLGQRAACMVALTSLSAPCLVGTSHYLQFILRPASVWISTFSIDKFQGNNGNKRLKREVFGTARIIRRRLYIYRDQDYRKALYSQLKNTLLFYFTCSYITEYLKVCADEPVAYIMFYTNKYLNFLCEPLKPLVHSISNLFVQLPATITDPLSSLQSIIVQSDQTLTLELYASNIYSTAAAMLVRTGILLSELYRKRLTVIQLLKFELEWTTYSIAAVLASPWAYFAVGLCIGNKPSSWYYYGAWLGSFLISQWAGNNAMYFVQRNITRIGQAKPEPKTPVYEDNEIEHFLGLIEHERIQCSQEDFKMHWVNSIGSDDGYNLNASVSSDLDSNQDDNTEAGIWVD